MFRRAAESDLSFLERRLLDARRGRPRVPPTRVEEIVQAASLDGVPLDVQEPQWNADLQKFGLPYTTVNGTDAFFTDYW